METKQESLKSKIIIGSAILFIVVIVGCLFLFNGSYIVSTLKGTFLDGIVSASSENINDERPIGYEFLDDGEVVHIWNNATISDYYFDKSSGIQFTNHYEEYWTRNVFCIGYYSGGTWNKIACADELTNFQKSIETDNETYVNATLWKWINLNIEGNEYPFRFGLRYHLGLNDENLSITIQGKNGETNIPFDLGFAWKVTDWDIPSNETDDYMIINNTGYAIKGTYDLIFKNMSHTEENVTIYDSYFKGRDSTYDFGGEFLRVDWNDNLNYAVKMYGNGIQEDFYVATLINAGHFNPQQEKSTTFQWIDALVVGTNCGFVTVAPTADPAASLMDARYSSWAGKYTSPATAVKVVEIGWWCDTATEEDDTEVGIYAHDSGDNEPGHILLGKAVFTKTTGAGWKKATVNIAISPNTIYWIAMELDLTTPDNYGNYASSGSTRVSRKTIQTTLTNPWGDSLVNYDNYDLAIYAVVELAPDEIPPTSSNNQTNTTIAGELALFSILYDDDTSLESDGGYIFSTNNSGVWDNDSLVMWTSTPQWANVSKTLPANGGNRTDYRWYANDSAGNINNTGVFSLTTIAGDTCTYTSGTWAVDCSDYCNITSEVDLAGEDITIIGDGEFTTTKDISNFGELYISGGSGYCDVTCNGGCFI